MWAHRASELRLRHDEEFEIGAGVRVLLRLQRLRVDLVFGGQNDAGDDGAGWLHPVR